MKKPTLIIVRGIPGSGKSTFAKMLTAYSRIFEADQYFYDSDGNYKWDRNKLHKAHQWCQNQVEKQMGMGTDRIVVSNTTTTEKELKPYLELADKYDYQVHTVIVENRHGGESIHDVPEEAIEKMKNRFNIKL